jgi:formylglycine-generating enzyme required for sulfatase activity
MRSDASGVSAGNAQAASLRPAALPRRRLGGVVLAILLTGCGVSDERLLLAVGGDPCKGSPAFEWVTIPYSSSLQLSRTEVTVGQYKACVDAGHCTPPDMGWSCNWGVPGRSCHPVNCVDWFLANKFAEWVGGRLPTDAEWVFAAYGAEGRSYPWGAEIHGCDEAVYNGCNCGHTCSVCSETAGNTPEGLCDMGGNVWEWAEDSEGSFRVVRGGSWDFGAARLRVAGRGGNDPGLRDGRLGFRPARSSQ